MSTEKKHKGKVLQGVVVSDKSDKTIVVRIERRTKHPLYSKVITKQNKVHAHDEKNECKLGDKVKIGEHRPFSKKKHWALLEIIERVG